VNIIHLLSQNHLTGAEVYSGTLIKEQTREQHQVYQISNAFFFETAACKIQRPVETKSRWQHLQNILWLRNFIRKQGIHVVHTHSRAAAKLGYWATFGTKCALVSTVHGVQHPSLSKKILNQYGQTIFAVCENIKKQLMRDFSYSESKIHVLANPISPELYSYQPHAKTPSSEVRIAIVGRTTGPKGVRTEKAILALFSNYKKPFHLTLIGGRKSQLNLPAQVTEKITEKPELDLNSRIYSEFDLIIGSGRVCMEALISGVPVIAFGEASYEGLITEVTFKKALESNFGDIYPDSLAPSLDAPRLMTDLAQLPLSADHLKRLSDKACAELSSAGIAKKIQRHYESAFFLKNYSCWIPVLMYHKIPEQPIESQHKIFVTRNDFKKHLDFFKSRGFKTLTFSELALFRTGKKSFSEFPKKPLILTFDDGYRDNLVNASPLLQQYNYRAQLFLLADSKVNHNQWDSSGTEPSHEIISGAEREKWLNSQFEIGSHGFSHRKITELSDAEALNELSLSKSSLEEELGIKINSFAFTYGVTSNQAAELAQVAGYDYALNTDSGGMLLEESPYAIFRANIFPNETRLSLWKKTSRWYRRYYRWKRKK